MERGRMKSMVQMFRDDRMKTEEFFQKFKYTCLELFSNFSKLLFSRERSLIHFANEGNFWITRI